MKHLFAAALAAALALPPAAPLRAGQDSGAYLAARQAATDNRITEAATLFARAVAADPDQLELRVAAAFFHAITDDMDAAIAEAETLEAAGAEAPHSALVLLVRDAGAGDWVGMLAALEAGRQTSPVIDAFARAWAPMGLGDMQAALAGFDAASAEHGLGAVARQHKAMALALAGDMEAAAALFADPATQTAGEGMAVLAQAEVLSQLDRNDAAIAVLDETFGAPPADATAADLRTRLAAGETLPFTQITTPAEGLAAAMMLVARAHGANDSAPAALLHARMAARLWPGDPGPELLSAEALLDMKRPDLAAEALARIPATSPARAQADLGRARALDSAGQTAEAIAVLEGMAFERPANPEIWSLLADMRRRENRMEEARAAYTRALDLTEDGAPAQWLLYYVRGIVNHDLDQWEDAKADFRAALAINPDQPNVLNYLGYSMVEKNENLEEALALIERAVELAPQNGAIVDSLAWALFRLGRAREVVAPMERAAELEPTDPVVTDHLGDVLWAVGRRYEAMFEWRRALSFDPTEEDAARIRHKLEHGLDLPPDHNAPDE